MQEIVASEVPQAGLAVLAQHGPADTTARNALHLCSGDGCHRASLDTVAASAANGVHNLWAAMRLHWLGGMLRA